MAMSALICIELKLHIREHTRLGGIVSLLFGAEVPLFATRYI